MHSLKRRVPGNVTLWPGGDEGDRKIKKWPDPHGKNMRDALSTGEAELETSLISIARATSWDPISKEKNMEEEKEKKEERRSRWEAEGNRRRKRPSIIYNSRCELSGGETTLP